MKLVIKDYTESQTLKRGKVSHHYSERDHNMTS